MKEMYLYSIKHFNETKNEKQIKLAYKEYEQFSELEKNFNFFFEFKAICKENEDLIKEIFEDFK